MKLNGWLKVFSLLLLVHTNSSHLMDNPDEFIEIQKFPVHGLSKNAETLLASLGKFTHERDYQSLEQDLILGAACNYALLTGDKKFLKKISDPTIQPHAVRGLIWFYYLLAVNKKQEFEEGTFTIVHPRSQEILEFLNRHPHKKLIEFLNVKLPTLQSTPESYERISSHFKAFMRKTDNKERHFGLDINNLPKGKQTLLYGNVDRNRHLIFIKPEDFGTLDIISLGHHGLGFIKSVAVKSQALRTYLDYWLPSDDDQSYRKERIPSALLKSYIDFVNGIERTDVPENVAELEDDAAVYGIQKIHQSVNLLLNSLADGLNAAEDKEKPAYIKLIKEGHALQKEITAYDHLDYRFGREVILTDHEFAIITRDDYEKLKKFSLETIIPHLRKAQ